MKDVMRFTVIDPLGKVSFVAPCLVLDALVAACARSPRTLGALLGYAEPYAPGLLQTVTSGLAVFDEHNSPDNPRAIHAAIETASPRDLPVFRVVDERTRQASLQPVRAGVVVFNLAEKRIVQIHNTYSEIRRKGRIRVLDASISGARVHAYELPADWALVPAR
jgi:hypothetical protein